MFKSIFTNSFGIFISRIFGFIREILTASFLGANIYSDIFFISIKFPNLFRRVFAEGAFSQNFIPFFSKSRYKSIFASSLFLQFICVILLLSLAVTFLKEPFTALIAPGFDIKENIKASSIVAINFYFLDLIFIINFYAALLQYKKHFFTSAFSSVFVNISMILGLFLSNGMAGDKILYYMSYSFIIGGVLQLLAHIIAGSFYKINTLLLVGFSSLKKRIEILSLERKKFYRGFFHTLVGSSMFQISSFIDSWLASFLIAGSISHLNYANRLFQFPLALFGIATATVIFPKVVKSIKNKKSTKDNIVAIESSFWILFNVLFLSTLIGVIFAKDIVHILFERGRFGYEDTITTSLVLIAYLLALVPYGLSKIFLTWLFATTKQKVVAKISTTTIVINIILSAILMQFIGVVGIALASSITGTLFFILILREFGWVNIKQIIYKKREIFLTVCFIIISAVILVALKRIIMVLF